MLTADDVGKRIIYTDIRTKIAHPGYLRGVSPGSNMCDVHLDEHFHARAHFFVPVDSVEFEDHDGSRVVVPPDGQ